MIKRIQNKLLSWDNDDTIERLSTSLKDYKLAITTTDTVLGLLALLDQQGFMALNHAKGGRSDKPYLILVGSPDKIFFFTDQKFSDCMVGFISKCWPGPVTLIFRARQSLPSFVVSQDASVALRCPDHQGLQKILHHFEGLFSTSANRSGKPVAQTIDTLEQELLDEVEYVVVDSVQRAAALPSTILDLTDAEHDIIRVVREGAYPLTLLEQLYGKKFST